jgi:phenylacetate-CoA ligase
MLMVPTSPLDDWTAGRLGVDRLTRSSVERWQLERLREVVAWARAHSPFYRYLYRDVPEDRLERLADSVRLPLVEHEVLRGHGLDLVCVSLGDVARVVTVPTSGSTGPAKRLWFTEEDLELTCDHFRHGMRALVGPGDRVLVLMPGKTPGSVGALLEEGLERDGVEVDSYGFIDDCAAVAKRIEEYRADCLVGVPGQIVRLARSAAGRGIGRGQIKSVLLSGDYVAPAMRQAIEAPWGCRVFEHYGSTELGLGGAVQCQAFAGLHIREADLLFEVIDPATGRTVADGAEGELVVTTLTRRGMPLIRFRTGDAVRMATTPCPCRSVLRSVEHVMGREDSFATLAGGGVVGLPDLDQVIYSNDPVLGFTAELGRGPAGERLTIRLDVREDSPTGLQTKIGSDLSSLPGLRAAVQAGTLEIVVQASPLAPAPPPAAKQTIVDSRGSQRGA